MSYGLTYFHIRWCLKHSLHGDPSKNYPYRKVTTMMVDGSTQINCLENSSGLLNLLVNKLVSSSKQSRILFSDTCTSCSFFTQHVYCSLSSRNMCIILLYATCTLFSTQLYYSSFMQHMPVFFLLATSSTTQHVSCSFCTQPVDCSFFTQHVPFFFSTQHVHCSLRHM